MRFSLMTTEVSRGQPDFHQQSVPGDIARLPPPRHRGDVTQHFLVVNVLNQVGVDGVVVADLETSLWPSPTSTV